MPLSGLHILVVEDESFIALDAEHLLLGAGAASVTLANRAGFEDALAAGRFNAMLVDTGPDRSHVEKDIARAQAAGARIAFTTSDTELVAGISGYEGIQFIAKPYGERQMSALIAGLRGGSAEASA